MDLNQVRAFVRVVEAGSFTSAARTLKVPKSSVSRAVTALETELGSKLLQRTTRKLALTEAGARYYESVSRALAGIDEATAAVRDEHASVRGTVRLTAPVDVAVAMLPDLIARFVRAHPGVHVELVLTSRLVDLIGEGFDLALRAGRLADSSLVARRLQVTELGLFAAPKYLKRRGAPRTVADLAEHECVLFRAERGRATWHLAGPEGEEKVTVTGPVSADDFAFLRQMLAAGAGIGILPTFLSDGAHAGKLERVLPGYAVRGAPLSVVSPPSRHVPKRVALFREFLIAELERRGAQ